MDTPEQRLAAFVAACNALFEAFNGDRGPDWLVPEVTALIQLVEKEKNND